MLHVIFVTMKINFAYLLKIGCIVLLLALFSCKPKAGHNRYREAKVRPSEKQLREDKKQIKRGSKAYRKQLRSNRKHLFGRASPN